MLRPMTRKQQMITASVCGLLLLGGMTAGVLQLQQQEPEQPEELPAETTAVSSETTAERISSSETTVQTTSTAAETSTETTETQLTATAEQTTAAATTTTETTTQTEVIPVESITLTFYEVQLYVGECAMPIVTMHPGNASDRTEIWSTSDNNVASISSMGNITANAAGECIIRVTAQSDPEVFAEVRVTVLEPPPTEPPTEPPMTEPPAAESAPPETAAPTETEPPPTEPPAVQPTYIGGILVVNKTYPLPADYDPGLDPTCKAQFDLLSQAAAAEGLNIWLASGYRSYDYQARIYNNYLNWYGQEKTDTLSARPGHSEHQTGLAIDVNSITDAFGSTPEAAWLAEHAHEFGFIIRYPKGKEHITGYKYEPWHIRYLGLETAAAVHASGLTLEEYLGITSCYAQ